MTQSALRLGFSISRLTVTTMLGALLLVALVGCSEEPAVCKSVEDLKSSWSELKGLDASSGVDDLKAAFERTRDDLDGVFEDARDEFAAEVTQVRTATEQLESAAQAAVDDPSADAITALRSAVTEFGSQVQSLIDAIADTC